jgi:nitrate/nitrite transport system substrate-binding protein
MKFWGEKGEVSYPWKSLDAWFVTENIRWGKFDAHARRKRARRQDQPLGSVDRGGEGARRRRPPDRRQRGVEKFFDGKIFDPANPSAYLASLGIKRVA